ncbi:LuxR C-terminal-related transcriptional regulator [Pseudonocardia hispaniensis]|uniref:LuxR C-terminal-related transcriptional regulator n=1 Tax=Pseudonocardia hispaniensis TaxID=904933 RepID=A0ABW1J2X8_9PSEU
MPRLGNALVCRPRLLTTLDRDDGDRATLVCAPSGFGKTALLAHWVRTGPGPGSTAWVNLDRDDNDPRRLWSAVLAAFRACPAVPPGALDELDPPVSPAIAFVADLADVLDALPVRVTLVLHDVHELVVPAALRGLEALVAARPAGVRLILCSRLDPPLAQGGPRSAGWEEEIRAAQLRFSPDETDAVLCRSGLRLTRAQTRAVHACTNGWPTGVWLTSLVLRNGTDPEPFLARFAGDDHPMADFLVGEALAALPDSDREFLSAISVGDAVSTGLAARLSGRADAGVLLDRLARTTGTVTRLPTGDYRVVPLLATYLPGYRSPRRSRAADPPGRAVHRQGAEADALDRAAHGGDDLLLAELIRRFTGELLVNGHHDALRRALSHLGPHVVAGAPWLALCCALTHVEAGEAATHADLHQATRLWPARPGPHLSILRSAAELFTAATDANLAASPTPISRQHGERDTPEWTALALAIAGGGRLFVDADPGAGDAALRQALRLATQHGFGYLEMQCRALLGAGAGLAGDYPAMTTSAGLAVAVAAAKGWERSPWSSASRWMLAYAALLRAAPGEARWHASEALRCGGPVLRPRVEFALRVVRGAALFDLGMRHRGLQEMRHARANLGAIRLTGEQAGALAVLEHRAAVALGHTAAADAVVDWLTERVGPSGEVLLMRAWAALSAGREGQARSLVGPLLDGSAPAVQPPTVIEALLVESAAGVSAGEMSTARHALRTALSTGATLDIVRPFAMAEPRARELLGQDLRHGRSAEPFALRALAAGRRVRPPTARLTETEVQVLARLPSALSVAQISEALCLPAEEVRAHVRAVYRKLGASSRRTAVSAAFERGLLN